jgi:hypothetical protein
MQYEIGGVACEPFTRAREFGFDVVAIEDRSRLVARQQHGEALAHTGANQIAGWLVLLQELCAILSGELLNLNSQLLDRFRRPRRARRAALGLPEELLAELTIDDEGGGDCSNLRPRERTRET